MAWTGVEWHGHPVQAWVPDRAADFLDRLTQKTRRRAEEATASVGRAGSEIPAGWEPLARLLLRTEGVASSQIEEVRAPLPDIVTAEIDPDLASREAGWVLDNLHAVMAAIDAAQLPLTLETLHGWHAALMRSSAHLAPRHVAAFRDEVGWVGGASPRVAAHVGAPPGLIGNSMKDLLRFVNRSDIEPTVQAGIAHAQFELIHPYADGNGRIGRVLDTWLLTRRLRLSAPPPVSVALARDRMSYVAGLAGFRELGPDRWVRYFADVVETAATETDALLRAVHTQIEQWEAELSDLRVESAARRALKVLVAHPVVSAELLGAELAVTSRSARTALHTLHERGVVTPYQPVRQRVGRPTQLWLTSAFVDLITSWGVAGL
ncbi:MAG: Fic family protein [Mycobacteriales bacterium]